MQIPRFTSKLTVPPVQRALVTRTRLIDALNRGLEGKLTLVCAPAGYGKTMLLSAWTAQCGLPAAWLTLDAGDNDLARFLSYLVAALEKVDPAFGSSAAALLNAPRAPAVEALLASIFQDVSQSGRRFLLILDDYHLIQENAVHAVVHGLLAHLPLQMHLVIASRADPPLQLARLRARSELNELRLADLCFSESETAQFCNRLMDLDLTGEQIAMLTSRTEGWIAGLQMAAISLHQAGDKAERIRSFSGSNRFILDYLVEEVLAGQPEEILTFLLQTSILDRLNGPLCNAVTDLGNSQEILERLERDNLFLIALDQERAWFRYHQLFLDLLRSRAHQRRPENLSEWHRRASRWFEQNNDLESAIQHALAAEAYERAAGLMEKAAQPFLMHSEIYTFQNWLRRLPESVLRARPGLVVYSAWTAALSDAAPDVVDRQLAWLDEPSEEINQRINVIRGFQWIAQGDTLRAAVLLQQALEKLAPEDGLFLSAARYILLLADVMDGRFSSGAEMLERTARASLEKGQLLLAAGALCTLAEIRLRLGQLQAARECYERALAAAVDEHGKRLPVAARALMGLADLWREWNDPERAATYAQEGIALSDGLRLGAALPGEITLARLNLGQGSREEALRCMQKAQDTARQTQSTGIDDMYVDMYWAAMMIRLGELDAVESWAAERGLTRLPAPADLDRKDNFYQYHMLKYDLLILARWRLARHEPAEALTIVDLVSERMEAQGRQHLLTEALLLKALAHQQQGDIDPARQAFRRALALAEPGGYIRLFLDEAPAVRPLLLDAAKDPATGAYALGLLAALDEEAARTDGRPPAPTAGPPALAWGEQLTARELELLRLIAAGLSNREIAHRLYLSLPTVKWHTSNIFSKLGARSRTQAVAQARALGVLPPDRS